MFYLLLFITFAVAIYLSLFAKDSYINAELRAYSKTIKEPWLDRIVVLLYDNDDVEE